MSTQYETATATTTPDPRIAQWVEQFHRDGYLVLHDVLSPEFAAELRSDLDRELEAHPASGRVPERGDDRDANLRLRVRMFEVSPANVRLFEHEPIVNFAEALVGTECHVMHNNSFITKPGGGIDAWHQDDAPHYLVTHGEPPTNVRLPVLLFTANYYLTDVEEPKYGPTEVVPRSHLFGRPCPRSLEGTPWEKQAVSCVGRAGTVVMFNNQVWHRGGPNRSDRTRYITQVSYGRRIIGHKYYPFMNYRMPEHVYAGASPRLKRLLGFLPMGAYG